MVWAIHLIKESRLMKEAYQIEERRAIEKFRFHLVSNPASAYAEERGRSVGLDKPCVSRE